MNSALLFLKRSAACFLFSLIAACASQPPAEETVRICNSGGCADRPKDYTSPDSPAIGTIEKDPQIEALKKLAKQDPSAAYDLGLRYFRGDGIRQDSYQAIQWMRDAAERGNLKAQMALGRLYLTGLSEMGADPGEAERWLMITSGRGDKEAIKLLKEATKARKSKQARHQWENRWRPNFYNNWYQNYPYYWQWNVNRWMPIQTGNTPYPYNPPLNNSLNSYNANPVQVMRETKETPSQKGSEPLSDRSQKETIQQRNNLQLISPAALESDSTPSSKNITAVSSEKAQYLSNARRIALVIGNGAYEFTGKLPNPVNDAHDIAQVLKKNNFQVILKTDATLEAMADAIHQFGESLKGGGIGLFYYSGHGVQVKGENYLLPVDTNLLREDEIKRKAISANDVLEKMGEGKSHLNLVFLDACRNNPFPSNTRSTSRGLSSMNAPSGTLLVFSTSPDNVAEDGVGRNGTYTKHLLDYIDQPDLEIGMLLRKVRTKVKDETGGKQIPWENGSIEGEFYFHEKSIKK